MEFITDCMSVSRPNLVSEHFNQDTYPQGEQTASYLAGTFINIAALKEDFLTKKGLPYKSDTLQIG